MKLMINIRSKAKYPACALSNFAPHAFHIYGAKVQCMESFLQSLKSSDPFVQKQIWDLTAREAKRIGGKQEWNRYLYWRGKPIDRFSKEYFFFIKTAYQHMFDQCPAFREALRSSKGSLLLHTIGKNRRSKTVLTQLEFVKILNGLRMQI